MPDLDHLGYCAVRPGEGDQLIFPLLPGATYPASRQFAVPGLSSNVYGPVNVLQGIRTPEIRVRARAFDFWFNVATLNQMFLRRDDGGLLGRTVSGLLAGSFGPVQWAYANETPWAYSACKIGRFRITWGQAGTPLTVEFTLKAYGGRIDPRPFRFGPAVGRSWHATPMAYGGLTGVEGGSLSIDNRLVMNPSAPNLPSIDGERYPSDYACDAPLIEVVLEQQVNSRVLDSTFSDGEGVIPLTFVSPTGASVRARVNVLAPDVETTVLLRKGKVLRHYRAMKPDALTAFMRFV